MIWVLAGCLPPSVARGGLADEYRITGDYFGESSIRLGAVMLMTMGTPLLISGLELAGRGDLPGGVGGLLNPGR